MALGMIQGNYPRKSQPEIQSEILQNLEFEIISNLHLLPSDNQRRKAETQG